MSSKLTCGYSLRGATRIIAVTDILVEIATMAFMIVELVGRIGDLQGNACPTYRVESNIAIIVLDSSSLLIHLVEFFIVYLVLQGAQQRNMPRCKIWARVTEALTTLDGIIFVVHMILEFDVALLAFMIAELIYKSYSVAVVEAYVREMQTYEVADRREEE